MFECQHGLNQTCDTCRFRDMSDIGFDRANRSKTVFLGTLTKGLS